MSSLSLVLVEASKQLAKCAEVMNFSANTLSTGLIVPEVQQQMATLIRQTEAANKNLLSATRDVLFDPNDISNVEVLSKDVTSSLNTMEMATQAAEPIGEGAKNEIADSS